jgi:hypothetical protein
MPSTQRKRRTQEVYNELLILADIQTRNTQGKNNLRNWILVTSSYKKLRIRLKLKKWMIKQYLIELEKLGLIKRDWDYVTDKGKKINNQLYLYIRNNR